MHDEKMLTLLTFGVALTLLLFGAATELCSSVNLL